MNLGNIDQMFNRPSSKNQNAMVTFKSITPLINKLSEWIDTYGPVTIGSNNDKLAIKWVNVLNIASRITGIYFKIQPISGGSYIVSK